MNNVISFLEWADSTSKYAKMARTQYKVLLDSAVKAARIYTDKLLTFDTYRLGNSARLIEATLVHDGTR